MDDISIASSLDDDKLKQQQQEQIVSNQSPISGDQQEGGDQEIKDSQVTTQEKEKDLDQVVGEPINNNKEKEKENKESKEEVPSSPFEMTQSNEKEVIKEQQQQEEKEEEKDISQSPKQRQQNNNIFHTPIKPDSTSSGESNLMDNISMSSTPTQGTPMMGTPMSGTPVMGTPSSTTKNGKPIFGEIIVLHEDGSPKFKITIIKMISFMGSRKDDCRVIIKQHKVAPKHVQIRLDPLAKRIFLKEIHDSSQQYARLMINGEEVEMNKEIEISDGQTFELAGKTFYFTHKPTTLASPATSVRITKEEELEKLKRETEEHERMEKERKEEAKLLAKKKKSQPKRKETDDSKTEQRPTRTKKPKKDIPILERHTTPIDLVKGDDGVYDLGTLNTPSGVIRSDSRSFMKYMYQTKSTKRQRRAVYR